ncbi:MAG: FIST C-terminal domain-containing protein [Candidatus Diapherotrites archaeon]|nr:FIST C-terminal domain-containing protein [Candidatus Diapherotrites archaeon]
MGARIRAGTGTSHGKNAGKKAAKEAMKNAGVNKCNFVVVYASSKYNPQAILDQVVEITGDVPLFGCTTAGNITEKGVHEDAVSVMVVDSNYFRVGVGVGQNVRKRPIDAGRTAAKNAMVSLEEDPRLMSLALFKKKPWEIARFNPYISLTAIDGLSGQEENVLQGIQKVVGSNPIFGGSAGDDLKLEKTFVFCNGKAYTDAVAVAVISTSLRTSFSSKHGWKPMNRTAIVTKAKGRRVFKLDDRPAAEVYAEMIGRNVKELVNEKNIAFTSGLKHPFGVPDITGRLWLRHPMRINKDLSIDFFAEMPVSTIVMVMKGSSDTLLRAGKRVAEEAKKELVGKPECGFIFNCVARKVFMKRNAEREIKEIYKKVKAPLIGFYTYGEQSPTMGGAICHKNQTIHLLLVSDSLITD